MSVTAFIVCWGIDIRDATLKYQGKSEEKMLLSETERVCTVQSVLVDATRNGSRSMAMDSVKPGIGNLRLGSQGRNEVRRCPGQEASLAPPSLNLRSFGRKFTALKKVLVKFLGLFCAPSTHLGPPAVIRRPIMNRRPENCDLLPSIVTSLSGGACGSLIFSKVALSGFEKIRI